MAKLIDIDAAIDLLGCEDEDIAFKHFLEELPAVEAVPVVHGSWVFGTANHREYMKCSECLHSYTPDGTFLYCPNCGADMR